MLDRLIEFLLECIGLFQFWIVLDPYEEGVLLRLGKFKRCLGPGFHWRIPFYVDQILFLHTVPQTHSLGDESVITSDGRAVAFHAIVTFRVKDIQKAVLEVADVDHAVRDACAGEVGRVMRESSWTDIIGNDILDKLTAACRKRGWRWGIEIMSVQLAGLALVKNIRLIQR
jgi:regulator of protease activity HflC (stomatin/prohibitin superfamily)